MIVEVKIRHCPNCESLDIIRNGSDYKGDQKYHCHHCGGYGTLNPKARYSQVEKAQVLKAYQERASMRGIRRIFGVVPQTLLRWIKAALETLPSLIQTLTPAHFDDGLELDELWSFVLKKSNKRWIWMALCRRTRQVVAYYVGDRRKRVVANCGSASQRPTRAVAAIVISGQPIKRFGPKKLTKRWVKKLDRPRVSSVGIISCGSVWLVLSVNLIFLQI
jgi:transposase-like protein